MTMRISSLFFLEKDMHAGKYINLRISKNKITTPFLPYQVAYSLPVPSNKLQDIYKAFDVNLSSVKGRLIKKTGNECEKPSNKGEDQYCLTSMESMADFATSKLGERVKVVSTQVNGYEMTSLQGYKLQEMNRLNKDDVVVCHKEYYVYVVYYRHKAPKVKAYQISLVGENNVKANTIFVCHEDTASAWNPNHLAYLVLNVKPRTSGICNFLPKGKIAWVPY